MPRIVTTITVRELKANASELLKRLEETPNLDFVITRHGKPCAKLTPLDQWTGKASPADSISLRNTWAELPELSDADFAEAKGVWEMKTGA